MTEEKSLKQQFEEEGVWSYECEHPDFSKWENKNDVKQI